MFDLKTICAVIVGCGLATACTRPAADTETAVTGPQLPASKSPVTFNAEDGGLTVFSFKEAGGAFLYDNTYAQGWTTVDDVNYTLRASMLTGDYRFLFAKNFGSALTLSPAAGGSLEFGQAGFDLAAADNGFYAPADELYLQTDDTQDLKYVDPAKTYTITANTTVSVKMKRAVSRIDVNLRRGYSTGIAPDGRPIMQEVPYAGNDNIINYIDGIELTVSGVGNRVGINGGQGSVAVFESLDPADATAMQGGFAGFEGPYVIPNGGQLTVDVKINPAPGSGIPVLKKEGITATLERNQQLIVNLWVDRLWPEIVVNVRAEDIEDEIDGDAGTWD